jgi:hypothetical protein
VRILVDLDNVLADFVQHVLEHFAAHPDDIPTDDLWVMVESVPNFWLTMPLKYRAHDLWDFVQPYNPVILTGCPKSHYEVAAAQKVTWVKQKFGEQVTVITCLSRDKQKYLLDPADILIDDFSSNVKRWRKAGGRAVRYKTYEQTIAELRILLNERPD